MRHFRVNCIKINFIKAFLQIFRQKFIGQMLAETAANFALGRAAVFHQPRKPRQRRLRSQIFQSRITEIILRSHHFRLNIPQIRIRVQHINQRAPCDFKLQFIGFDDFFLCRNLLLCNIKAIQTLAHIHFGAAAAFCHIAQNLVGFGFCRHQSLRTFFHLIICRGAEKIPVKIHINFFIITRSRRNQINRWITR